jgi:hypothetical protein
MYVFLPTHPTVCSRNAYWSHHVFIITILPDPAYIKYAPFTETTTRGMIAPPPIMAPQRHQRRLIRIATPRPWLCQLPPLNQRFPTDKYYYVVLLYQKCCFPPPPPPSISYHKPPQSFVLSFMPQKSSCLVFYVFCFYKLSFALPLFLTRPRTYPHLQ